MIKRMLTLSGFAFVATLSTTSFAQPAGGGSDSDAISGKNNKGVTVYDFEDDDVDGEILSPDGANLSSRGRGKHASLITIRPHFIPEMIKMANDI